MANTYTQIHIHAIFAVQNRQSLMHKDWRDELYSYITGILQNQGHKMLQINGVEDHVHMLFGMRPSQSLSELMKSVKQHSTVWINDKGLAKGPFKWQAGYSAFSHSKSQIPDVISYIQNQEEHHRKKSFQEEYLDFFQRWDVEFDQRYIFKPVV
jgi:putative transposase